MSNPPTTPGRDARGHADPRVPARDRCVVRYLIDRWAAERGDQAYVIFDGGRQWTYRELRERVVAVAAGLQHLGVRQGEHVLCWLPNTPDMLLTYYALNYLGAVYVPINTAYRGGVLEHVIENSDARLAVVHADLVPRLHEVDRWRSSSAVVVIGADVPPPAPLPAVPFASLPGREADAAAAGAPDRAVGHAVDHLHLRHHRSVEGRAVVLPAPLHQPGPESWHFVDGSDRFLVNLPMFHVGGMGLCFAMLARGGSIALRRALRHRHLLADWCARRTPPRCSCWASWRPSC